MKPLSNNLRAKPNQLIKFYGIDMTELYNGLPDDIKPSSINTLYSWFTGGITPPIKKIKRIALYLEENYGVDAIDVIISFFNAVN